MASSKGTAALLTIAISGALLSGCANIGYTVLPPPPPGFASCEPTYPGFYVWPPFKACYPPLGFNSWFTRP